MSQFGTIRVDVSQLHKRGGRPGFVDYLINTWESRSFAVHEAKAQVNNGGQHQFLGNLWLIINPILDGAIYFVIFGLVLRMDKGIENFIGFLLIGVFFFQITAKCVSGSTMSVHRVRAKGKGGALPDLLAPLGVNLRTWLIGLPSYLVMLVMVLLIEPVEPLSFKLLILVPVIMLQAAVALGIATLCAYLVSFLPDLNNLIRVAVRAWMFGSGVMFPAERFADIHPVIGILIHWNPMTWVLNAARDVTLYDTMPALEGWLIMVLWAVVPLLAGSWLIWRSEGRSVAAYKAENEEAEADV